MNPKSGRKKYVVAIMLASDADLVHIDQGTKRALAD